MFFFSKPIQNIPDYDVISPLSFKLEKADPVDMVMGRKIGGKIDEIPD